MLSQRVRSAWQHFEHGWHSHHLSHRGRYSIERMQLLNEYCQRNNLVRTWTVCLIFPLPPLFVIFFMEIFPLQDPADGWSANYSFWIRCLIAFAFVGIGILVQFTEAIPALGVSPRHMFVITLSASISAVAQFMGLAYGWAFPVPFGLVIVCTCLVVLLIALLMVAIGREQFKKNPDLDGQVRDQIRILGLETVACTVYPVFGAIYNSLPSNERPMFMVVFPLTKIVLSNAVAYVARNVVESIPGKTLLSVELFNALYAAKCMQNAGSHMTYVTILGFDLFESVMAYRDIRSQTEELYHRMNLKPGQTLSERVIELCLEPGVLQTSSIQLRSLVKVRSISSIENRAILDKLERMSKREMGPPQSKVLAKINTWVSTRAVAAIKSIGSSKKSVSGANPSRVIFVPSRVRTTRNKVSPNTTQNQRTKIGKQIMTLADKQLVVNQALGILFQCEFHVLTEFVECIVPLMYAMYMAIMFHLPSVQYFTDMAGMTSMQLERTVISILTYAWLEVLSFIALHFVIKHKLGISPASMLAFVLESQFLEFQGRIVLRYLFLLSFTLYHSGVDLTLRFEWLHQKKN